MCYIFQTQHRFFSTISQHISTRTAHISSAVWLHVAHGPPGDNQLLPRTPLAAVLSKQSAGAASAIRPGPRPAGPPRRTLTTPRGAPLWPPLLAQGLCDTHPSAQVRSRQVNPPLAHRAGVGRPWLPGPGTHAPHTRAAPPARMKPCAMASAIRPAPTNPTRSGSIPCPAAGAAAILPRPGLILPRPASWAPPMGYTAPLSSSIGCRDVTLRPLPSGLGALGSLYTESLLPLLLGPRERGVAGVPRSMAPDRPRAAARLAEDEASALRARANHGRTLGAWITVVSKGQLERLP